MPGRRRCHEPFLGRQLKNRYAAVVCFGLWVEGGRHSLPVEMQRWASRFRDVRVKSGSPPPTSDIRLTVRDGSEGPKAAKCICIISLLSLWLAERSRAAGNSACVRELITFAVETWPTHAALRNFEASIQLNRLAEIDWQAVLLPPFSS
jgi:hypothetical protein